MAVDATIFGRTRNTVELPAHQLVDGGLVEADETSQRAGDQVQLVLDHEVRRAKPGSVGQR